ncbi:unnamed protein product [Cylindrotheca closterium]|uniref:ABC transporter domain-containing protein n=1 Tax=Cylindrotheca closterium TaxID=2856 RepID=A0AAD2G996_9STRA|nr:unnamed protein product [Cylindrotheca closterium]
MTRVLLYRYLLSLSFYRSITVQSFSIQHAYYDNHVTNNNRIPVTFSSSLLLLLQASSGASDDNSNQNDDNEDHNDNDDDGDICWHPCSIEISNLSHQYPVTLWRTLTSSEPRREFALQDVSLKLGPHEFVLLLGDSSSGKSTLLRLILGLEERKIVQPTFGTIQIAVVVPHYSKEEEEEEDDDDNATEILPPPAAVPVLLDQKPVYSNNRGSQTVQMILQEKLKKMNKASTIIQHHDEKSSQTTLFLIIERLCELMDLPLTKKGSDLSPSEAYRCAMTEASLESILTGKAAAAAVNDDDDRDETSKTISSFPAPILLLDEWLDKETSTVVQNVQTSILKLIQTSGAIVVSITHKPNLYKQSIKEEEKEGEESSSHVRSITLRRGKIVA